MTKQLRRIVSLRSRLHKIQSYPCLWHRTILSLWQEWLAICNYRYKTIFFHEWILTVPELQPMPVELPTLEWMFTLEQIFKHEINMKVNQEKETHA